MSAGYSSRLQKQQQQQQQQQQQPQPPQPPQQSQQPTQPTQPPQPQPQQRSTRTAATIESKKSVTPIGRGSISKTGTTLDMVLGSGVEKQLVLDIPDLTLQADRVLDAYLAFNDFDRLDDEAYSMEAKARRQMAVQLQHALQPYLPTEGAYFDLIGLEKRLGDDFTFERRDCLRKVNLALFINALFDGMVDDLMEIQASFRESIYGSDASIVTSFSNVWLALKTQAYIRQKESDPTFEVEIIFPATEKETTHLLMGSKGGRASQSLLHARAEFQRRAEHLHFTNIDNLVREFPWVDCLQHMQIFTREERRVIEDSIPTRHHFETVETFATIGPDEIAEAAGSLHNAHKRIRESEQLQHDKRARLDDLAAASQVSQLVPQVRTTQIHDSHNEHLDQEAILAQTQRFFEVTRSATHTLPTGPTMSRVNVTSVDESQIDDQLRAMGTVGSQHPSGISQSAMEVLAHYPIPPKKEVRVRKERKKARPWSDAETSVLIMMIGQMGPRWAAILDYDKKHGGNIFEGRDQVALKDKARNVKRKLLNNGEKLPAQWEGVTMDARRGVHKVEQERGQ